MKHARGLWLASGSVLLSVLLIMPSAAVQARKRTDAVMAFPDLRKGDRLTIIAPHPDDETIALGGLIYKARQQHIPVSVIFLTNGDGSYEGAENEHIDKTPESMVRLGKMRQQEALQALSILGVKSSSTYFLGLPDGGMEQVLSKDHVRVPYTSPTTELSNAKGYSNSYVKNMPYTGIAAKAALLKAVNATRPTRVFVTMREDLHRDHWAAGQLLQSIVRKVSTRPAQYSYLVHYPGYGTGAADESIPLQPPAGLNRPWDSISLSADEEAHQAQAIQAYKSQLKWGDALDAITNFTRPNELVIE